jgi:hypothetical protein
MFYIILLQSMEPSSSLNFSIMAEQSKELSSPQKFFIISDISSALPIGNLKSDPEQHPLNPVFFSLDSVISLVSLNIISGELR